MRSDPTELWVPGKGNTARPEPSVWLLTFISKGNLIEAGCPNPRLIIIFTPINIFIEAELLHAWHSLSSLCNSRYQSCGYVFFWICILNIHHVQLGVVHPTGQKMACAAPAETFPHGTTEGSSWTEQFLAFSQWRTDQISLLVFLLSDASFWGLVGVKRYLLCLFYPAEIFHTNQLWGFNADRGHHVGLQILPVLRVSAEISYT